MVTKDSVAQFLKDVLAQHIWC